MAQRSSGRFSEEAIRAAVFTRRALLLGGVQILALGAVAARLNLLGQNEDLRSQGLENRTEEALIRPERGKVYDRNRNALAINTSNFRALFGAYRGQSCQVQIAVYATLRPCCSSRLRNAEPCWHSRKIRLAANR